MATTRRIITDNTTLRRSFRELAAGDMVLGRLRLLPTEELLLLDLVERGVILFPSALSQAAGRSKALQAALFADLMLPHTIAIHDIHGLQEAVDLYHSRKIGKVVTKQDRKNAGMGVHLWNSVEEVFNQASLGVLPYPFVLQPFYEGGRDIRVVVLGEYVEAYLRENPNSFRNNLHFGGRSTPCTLTDSQWLICREAMTRGRFPYAHVDLMVLPDNSSFLAEINLRGGIRGAKISPQEYQERLAAIHAQAADTAQ